MGILSRILTRPPRMRRREREKERETERERRRTSRRTLRRRRTSRRTLKRTLKFQKRRRLNLPRLKSRSGLVINEHRISPHLAIINQPTLLVIIYLVMRRQTDWFCCFAKSVEQWKCNCHLIPTQCPVLHLY